MMPEPKQPQPRMIDHAPRVMEKNPHGAAVEQEGTPRMIGHAPRVRREKRPPRRVGGAPLLAGVRSLSTPPGEPYNDVLLRRRA